MGAEAWKTGLKATAWTYRRLSALSFVAFPTRYRYVFREHAFVLIGPTCAGEAASRRKNFHANDQNCSNCSDLTVCDRFSIIFCRRHSACHCDSKGFTRPSSGKTWLILRKIRERNCHQCCVREVFLVQNMVRSVHKKVHHVIGRFHVLEPSGRRPCHRLDHYKIMVIGCCPDQILAQAHRYRFVGQPNIKGSAA